MFQNMVNPVGGSGGMDFSSAVMGESFTSTNGSQTISVSGVTNIKAVVYWLDNSPQYCGYGYKNGSTIEKDNNLSQPTLGITDISGNTFTFLWNNVYTWHCFVIPE